MPTDAEIDIALEAVVMAARNHRSLLGSPGATEEEIWTAYVSLNDASVHYDDVINRAYDEVTPWDCEYIEDDGFDESVQSAPGSSTRGSANVGSDDDSSESQTPHETVDAGARYPQESGAISSPLQVAVRHRRDYVVSSVPELLAAANEAAGRIGRSLAPVTHVGQALYLLIEAGDGTIAALDEFDVLEPGNGVLLVNEIASPVAMAALDSDPELGFRLGARERLLYRLDEVMSSDDDEAPLAVSADPEDVTASGLSASDAAGERPISSSWRYGS